MRSNNSFFSSQHFTVDLWILKFDALTFKEQLLKYLPLLETWELEKYASFATCVLRERYAFSHILLRLLLARYLNCSTDRIQFGFTEKGKPYINSLNTDLSFNMSHSKDWVAYAIGKKYPLGVDIEEKMRSVSACQIVDLVCTSDEKKEWMRLKTSQDREWFFLQIWTAKESAIKMFALGLDSLKEMTIQTSYQSSVSTALYNRESPVKIRHFYGQQYTVSLSTTEHIKETNVYSTSCLERILGS